jgi:hypothetical protein
MLLEPHYLAASSVDEQLAGVTQSKYKELFRLISARTPPKESVTLTSKKSEYSDPVNGILSRKVAL